VQDSEVFVAGGKPFRWISVAVFDPLQWSGVSPPNVDAVGGAQEVGIGQRKLNPKPTETPGARYTTGGGA